MCAKYGLAQLIGILAFVAFGFSMIWLFYVKQPTRFWGAAAGLVCVGLFIWAVRVADRNKRS